MGESRARHCEEGLLLVEAEVVSAPGALCQELGPLIREQKQQRHPAAQNAELCCWGKEQTAPGDVHLLPVTTNHITCVWVGKS